MELWAVLGNIVILLAACLLVGGVFSRLGQSPLVGYLLAGMLLGGPGSVLAVKSQHEIEAIAELGVALLLFSLGLEFSINRLKKLGAKPLMGGALQVLLTVLLGMLAAIPFGLSIKEAVAFGSMVALSSTAIVLRTLMERGEMEMPHGRNSLAVLLVQDVAVVPLALLMATLGGEGTAYDVVLDIGKLLLMAIGLVVCLFLLTRLAVLVLGTITLHRNRELTMVFAVVMGLGSALASHSVGISPALGAFVAGMMLGSSAFATQIRADVSPLRIVLLTLFFGAAGMVADPVWLWHNWHIVAAVVVAVTVGKLLVTWVVFRMLGQSTRVSAATGLSLAGVGEFAFVLGSIGRISGVVTEEVYALIVSVAIVSFFLSAFLVPVASSFGNRIAQLFRSRKIDADNEQLMTTAPDVVIIGFGPAGQIAARPLVDKEINVAVIDLNQDGVKKARELGFHGEVGDATQNEVLEHVRLHDCNAVVITVPHYLSALTMLDHVRKEAPEAHVIVRSRHEIHSGEFLTAGAHAVAGDEEEVGERLAEQISRWLDQDSAFDERPHVPNGD